MAELVRFEALDHGPHAHEFVGAEHGEVPFSVILVHSRPGVGPTLHRHPYAEVFVVESGQATFQIGDETVVVDGGHVVVSPPGEAWLHEHRDGRAAVDRDPWRGAVRHGMAGRSGSDVDVDAQRCARRVTCRLQVTGVR